jgi:hypothetical protein
MYLDGLVVLIFTGPIRVRLAGISAAKMEEEKNGMNSHC